MTTGSGEEVRIWRPHWFRWGMFLVLGVGPLALTIGVGVRDAIDRPGGVGVWFSVALVFTTLWGVWMYRSAIWPRLWAGPSGIIVRNRFSRFDLKWSEISKITGGNALTIETIDGRVIQAQVLVTMFNEGHSQINPGEVEAAADALNGLRPGSGSLQSLRQAPPHSRSPNGPGGLFEAGHSP